MELCFETTALILVAVLGIRLGDIFSRLRKPYWLFGYFLPLLFISILVTIRFIGTLNFLPPSFFLVTGDIRSLLLALSITMGLTTSLPHLPHNYEKATACVLMVVFVIRFSVSPYIAPALCKDDLSNLKTNINSDGICFQSKDYTCGPASAVTALRKLGFDAKEGEISVLARTSPVTGTLPQNLYAIIQNLYGYKGLKCQYRYFDSISELKDQGVILAVIKDTFLSDHCVAVLDVSDRTVVIADPVLGKMTMSHEQFEKIWRFSGIVLTRDPSESI